MSRDNGQGSLVRGADKVLTASAIAIPGSTILVALAAFSLSVSECRAQTLSKEYIRLGGRVIAIENAPQGTPSTATFVTQDTTTQGTWRGVYGGDGYNVIGDQAVNPLYVTPSPTGQTLFVWNSSVNDPRALQKGSNPSDRIAAGWYTSTSMTVDLPITDTNTHRIALYLLDWDTIARRETVDILDGNGNVLDTRSLTSSFNSGVYLVWNVSGHIKARITVTAGANAVISGLFFGPPSTVAPVPALHISKTHTGNFTQGQQNATYQVSVSNPGAGATGGTVTVTETVPSGLTLVTMSGSGWSCSSNTCNRSDSLGSGGSYPAITVTVNVSAGASSPQVNQISVSGGGSASASASDSTVINSSGSAQSSATFVRSDASTQGNWRGVYGGDGYIVVGDQTLNPTYVTPSASGQNPFTWIASTTDVRALQKASNPSDRIAAGWYTYSSMTIDMPIADSNTHQLALYLLDWDTTARREQVDILDGNGNVLNTQTLSSSFNGGVYLVWNVTGHVQARVTLTGGANAVLSGVFFGVPSSGGGSSATFVKLDTTTQGSWRGVYGADGYNVINDQAVNPTYVVPNPSGQSPFTWNASTTDVRALQKASNPSDRIAAGWYTYSSYTLDLPITDSNIHQFAVYCLDWDTTTRQDRLDILDANGNVLNTQTISGFSGGTYAVWNVSGHVKLQVTLTGGANAVISGYFFR